MRLFISNLHFDATEPTLVEFISQRGYLVASVTIKIKEDERGRRCFAFVECNEREAEAAIAALNGAEFMGRRLNVQIANVQDALHVVAGAGR